jgi:hypothetical protein
MDTKPATAPKQTADTAVPQICKETISGESFKQRMISQPTVPCRSHPIDIPKHVLSMNFQVKAEESDLGILPILLFAKAKSMSLKK